MSRQRLLLVGWDSADWKLMHPLIDAGHLPGVARLVESGTSGNITTLEPQLSPMLWTSTATGHRERSWRPAPASRPRSSQPLGSR